MPHLIYILFLFAFGACVGSFLNVVVWRLPRIEYLQGEGLFASLIRTLNGLSHPPSHCPKCGNRLKWYDNMPVIGWIKLGGKCRFCALPISPRYPIVEAVTGGLFVLYYVLFFILQIGPCPPVSPQAMTQDGFVVTVPAFLTIVDDWPMYGLYMFAVACLLAASLIDAERFIIPIEIPWLMAIVAVVVHAIIDRPTVPGALNLSPWLSAASAGASVGLILSIALWFRGILPTSFPNGEPILEVDRPQYEKEAADAKAKGDPAPPLPPPYTSWQIRVEMGKEMLFLTPPMLLAAFSMALALGPMAGTWTQLAENHWLTGLLGSLWGACIGAFVVWFFRIAGTLFFGRVAMGLGDVHLMFGVGAVVGAFGTTVAFFLAPFFAILLHVYLWLVKGKRELPYGPYLSLATGFVMIFSCRIADYLSPGGEGLVIVLRQMFAGPDQ